MQLGKFISCQTLIDQIRVTVGRYDLELPGLERKYPLGVDFLFGTQCCIDPILKTLASFVEQEEMYWLLMIFVLLDSIPSAKMVSLHKKIYHCLLKMIQDQNPQCCSQPDVILAGFFQKINQIKILLRRYNF